jgi:flagellar basal body P-ring formation protein FlgA
VDKSLRLLIACSLIALAAALPAHAGESNPLLNLSLTQNIRQMTQDIGRQILPDTRVEVEIGQLDPRLRLAPCQQIEPYLPRGARPWGQTRVGLRCTKGERPWNVFLPVTVHVYAHALVAAAALPAGIQLESSHFKEEEVDIAATRGQVITLTAMAVGRELARPLLAGQPLHQADLRARQYFAAGQTVRIVAAGKGYQVSSQGQALSPGLEGQLVRVRMESGRVVSGLAVAEHRVEITL